MRTPTPPFAEAPLNIFIIIFVMEEEIVRLEEALSKLEGNVPEEAESGKIAKSEENESAGDN